MRVLILACVLLASAQAQTTGAPPPDSSHSVSVPFPYGQAATYRAILMETRALRPLPLAPIATDSLGDPVLGLGRLVVDETISRTGAYFYDVFYRLWQPPPDAQFMSVAVSEQPLPGQGTLIAIRLDGELVFQSRLTPREEEAETLAQQAVAATARRLPRG